MRSRLTIAGVSVAVLLGVTASTARSQQNPYRLKETDQTKLCLACHTDFEATLKKKFVHTAVRTGECTGCHDPHVSSHGKLLSAGTRQICVDLPRGDRPGEREEHPQGRRRRRLRRSATTRTPPTIAANLLTAGNDLCVGCHKDLGAAVAAAKFKHVPVGQGCVTCHDPHGSDQSVRLLKKPVPALCLGCHKPDSPLVRRAPHEIPGGEGGLHDLPRPARLEPAGAAAQQRAPAAREPPRATGATSRPTPRRRSPPRSPATSSARTATARW